MFKIDLAIKFGSNEIIVYRKAYGIVTKVPAYLAIKRDGKKVKVQAIGKNAEILLRASSQNVEVLNPIVNSEIVDEKMAVLLMSEILKDVIQDRFLLTKLRALVAVPSGMKEEQLIKIKRVLLEAGINNVSFVINSVGARNMLDVDSQAHIMVVDIGKYLTDISILNEYNFTFGRTYFFGGVNMDKSITTFISDNHGLKVNDRTSEMVKNEIASLYERDLNKIEYSGFDNDKLVKHEITANEIRVAIVGLYDKIFEFIEDILKQVSKEVLHDIYNFGIMFVGGASSIPGLYEYAKKKLDLPIIVPDDPSDCVINGVGKLMSSDKEFLKINV